MKRALGRRAVRVILAAGALLALAGGIAYATVPGTDGVIHSCYSQSLGTWRPIDTQANPPQKCKSGETQLDFNQKGLKGDPGPQGIAGALGKDGVSVTSQTLASGDANCANGGSVFTAANGVTYACNGASGAKGDAGPMGPPGTFAGQFVSPNGQYSIEVTDQGITLKGPFGAQLSFSSLDTDTGVKSVIEFDGNVIKLNSADVNLGGAACGAGVARAGDAVAVNPSSGDGTIKAGSTRVFAC